MTATPVDAFVACGGNPDKSGHVAKDTLIHIIKESFGLTIDIESLIKQVDTDSEYLNVGIVSACTREATSLTITETTVGLVGSAIQVP